MWRKLERPCSAIYLTCCDDPKGYNLKVKQARKCALSWWRFCTSISPSCLIKGVLSCSCKRYTMLCPKVQPFTRPATSSNNVQCMIWIIVLFKMVTAKPLLRIQDDYICLPSVIRAFSMSSHTHTGCSRHFQLLRLGRRDGKENILLSVTLAIVRLLSTVSTMCIPFDIGAKKIMLLTSAAVVYYSYRGKWLTLLAVALLHLSFLHPHLPTVIHLHTR